MIVEIDRAKWRTGRYGMPNSSHEIAGESELQNREGFSCCLGFLGAAHGVPESHLRAKLYPGIAAEWPRGLFVETDAAEPFGTACVMTQWRHVLALLNDATGPGVDDATREQWIATGFREVLGVEVRFVGEYPSP